MTGVVVGLFVLMALGVTGSAILQGRFHAVRPPEPRRLQFYEVAYLAGGRSRVADVALAYLVWAGLVDIRPGAGVLAMVAAPSRHVELAPVEAALVSTISADGRKPTIPLSAAREAAGSVPSTLAGYVVPPRDRLLARAPAVGSAVLAAVVAMGIAVSIDDRWGFLAVVPLVAVIVVATAMLGGTRLTKAGVMALAEEHERHAKDLSTAEMGVTSLPLESGMYIIALHGRVAMTGGLAPLRRVLR